MPRRYLPTIACFAIVFMAGSHLRADEPGWFMRIRKISDGNPRGSVSTEINKRKSSVVTAVSTIPLEVKGGYGIETEAFRLVDGREVPVGKVAAKWMGNGELFVSGKVNVPLMIEAEGMRARILFNGREARGAAVFSGDFKATIRF